ncbi:MAG: tRNA preQ1(34) S-adenosylmethionine ribosyltransferase-isomerase QueA [Pseudomonadota bacterium]
MDLSAFDFDLPERLIALRPVMPRDQSRLLVVRGTGELQDHIFADLPALLDQSDTLVFNDTRVLPAALKGIRRARDAFGHDVPVDVNLVEPIDDLTWRALARPGKRLRIGDQLDFGGEFHATLLAKGEEGRVDLAFACPKGDLRAALEAYGNMPLPPYIARRRAADAKDKTDYQTRFAGDHAASVAAPTAGLHFTERVLSALEEKGVDRCTVRLHVGLGTFAPLTETHWQSARLHEEWRSVDTSAAAQLTSAREAGRRIIAVGTTAMRTLESAVDASGQIRAVEGPTDIFLRPGDAIQATGGLVTNFHLPKSSLFMLVAALMGTELMQAAYAHAIAEDYRFYSYGDACLLLP